MSWHCSVGKYNTGRKYIFSGGTENGKTKLNVENSSSPKTAQNCPKTRRKLIYCLSKLDFTLVACGEWGEGIKMFKQTSS